METIAGIAQASSSGAHETAQTVQSLVSLARQLEQALARFKTSDQGAVRPRGRLAGAGG